MHWVALIGLAGCLSACGGGGGGGGGTTLPPAPSGNVAAVPAKVSLSGKVTFDSVPNPSGALAYAAAVAKPVRGAPVEIIDDSASVITTATTDGSGNYAVEVPSNTSVSVRVRAQLVQSGPGASWDVSVRDNTQSEAIYSMESPLFSSGASAVTRDLNAPSGWSGLSYGARRVAAPFAILDTVYESMSKVRAVAPASTFPPLKLFWSTNNVAASGDRALGQIGTTSFLSDGATIFSIYVLGKENSDTDEYDSSVIAHEWGHYYQAAFSRDDSPGGAHSLSERLDRRLAFSEGWGNAWSGIALERGNYTDSVGPGQGAGSNINLTTGASSGVAGWFRESSIHALLWNLNRIVGFKPIHEAMTGGVKAGAAVTSIHSFLAAFTGVAPSRADTLAELARTHAIGAVLPDPFGEHESNDGGLALTLPMYVKSIVGTSATGCVSNELGRGNKLGNFVYFRFAPPQPGRYRFEIAGPGAAFPSFSVYSGRKLTVSDATASSGAGAGTVELPSGEAVLVLSDASNSSASTCFQIQFSAVNQGDKNGQLL